MGSRMSILRLSFGQNPYVGAFVRATDKFALIPDTVPPSTVEKIKETLKVDVYKLTLDGSRLLGVFLAANSKGLLVPHFVDEKQISILKELIDMPIARLPSQFTSLGNLILVNDNRAICAPALEDDAVKVVEDTLDVEVVKRRIVSSELVGTVAVVTNKGMLVHPLANEDELSELSEIMGVPANVGTVNLGSPYVAIGLVANSYGALVGDMTTGPEIARISETFEV